MCRRPALLLALALVAAGPPRGVQADSTPQGQPASAGAREGRRDGADPPVDSAAVALGLDLDRIRRALERPSSLELDLPADARPMFRVDVEGKLPDIKLWLGDPRDLRRGPSRWPSPHEEFLRLVTPEEATASFTSGELLQVLATGLAGGLAMQGLIGAVRSAIVAGRSARACLEVRDSLVDLNIERAKAGLSPVPVPGCR